MTVENVRRQSPVLVQMWHLLLFDGEVFKKPEPSHRLVQSPLVIAEDLAACSTTVPVQMWQG